MTWPDRVGERQRRNQVDVTPTRNLHNTPAPDTPVQTFAETQAQQLAEAEAAARRPYSVEG